MSKQILSEIKQLQSRPKHYWKYYYKRLRRNNGASAKQILVGQIIGVSISILAGIYLDEDKSLFVIIPGTLLLLPGLIDVIASVSAALSVKINHHLKETNFKTISILLHDSWYSLRILLIASCFVGGFAGVIGQVFFEANILKLIILSVLTSLIIGLIAFPIISLGVVYIRSLKLDPDELVGPVETSVVDVLVVIVLSLVIGWFK